MKASIHFLNENFHLTQKEIAKSKTTDLVGEVRNRGRVTKTSEKAT